MDGFFPSVSLKEQENNKNPGGFWLEYGQSKEDKIQNFGFHI